MSEEEAEKTEGEEAEKLQKKVLKDKPAETAGPMDGMETGANAAPNMIAQANSAAERLEKANAELKKTLDRQERFEADRIASGRGFAGQSPTEPKKETDKEYWDRVKKGEL